MLFWMDPGLVQTLLDWACSSFHKAYNLGQNRRRKSDFETFLKPITPIVGQKTSIFPKSCTIYIWNPRLWALTDSIISNPRSKVHALTLRAFWHKNNGNRSKGGGWAAFEWEGMFLTLLFRTLPSLNPFVNSNNSCTKSCKLVLCSVHFEAWI